MRRIPGRIWIADPLARRLSRVAKPIPALQLAGIGEQDEARDFARGMLTRA